MVADGERNDGENAENEEYTTLIASPKPNDIDEVIKTLTKLSLSNDDVEFQQFTRDYSDRTFLFIKNIYKSKNRYNYQVL